MLKHDHEATTLIVSTDWLAVLHLDGATTFRLSAARDAAELTSNIILLLDRRAVTITRILLDDVSGPKAPMYRRACVAIAEAIGAQIGRITELGYQHFKTLAGSPQGNRAAWIAEGLRLLKQNAPTAKLAGVEVSPPFEIVNVPSSFYVPETCAERLRALLTECRRHSRFWRQTTNVALSELTETY